MSKQASLEPKLVSLREHPRAAPAIRRLKAYGGLVGFGIAVLKGLGSGSPFATTLLHGLEFGLVGNLVAWAAAVVIWKRVLTAQATQVVRDRERRLAEAAARAAAE
jgi:uncharacterized membrane protein YccC